MNHYLASTTATEPVPFTLQMNIDSLINSLLVFGYTLYIVQGVQVEESSLIGQYYGAEIRQRTSKNPQTVFHTALIKPF